MADQYPLSVIKGGADGEPPANESADTIIARRINAQLARIPLRDQERIEFLQQKLRAANRDAASHPYYALLRDQIAEQLDREWSGRTWMPAGWRRLREAALEMAEAGNPGLWSSWEHNENLAYRSWTYGHSSTLDLAQSLAGVDTSGNGRRRLEGRYRSFLAAREIQKSMLATGELQATLFLIDPDQFIEMPVEAWAQPRAREWFDTGEVDYPTSAVIPDRFWEATGSAFYEALILVREEDCRRLSSTRAQDAQTDARPEPNNSRRTTKGTPEAILQAPVGAHPPPEIASEPSAEGLPPLQKAVLKIARELWPDGDLPPRAKDRDDKIIAAWPRGAKPSSKTIQRAFRRWSILDN